MATVKDTKQRAIGSEPISSDQQAARAWSLERSLPSPARAQATPADKVIGLRTKRTAAKQGGQDPGYKAPDPRLSEMLMLSWEIKISSPSLLDEELVWV